MYAIISCIFNLIAIVLYPIIKLRVMNSSTISSLILLQHQNCWEELLRFFYTKLVIIYNTDYFISEFLAHI